VSGSGTFEWLCKELEARTSLSMLEARGTVRLVLKDLGLDAASVTSHQMQVVIQRLLGPALAKRKVADAPALCALLSQALGTRDVTRDAPVVDDAYDLFERLESDTTRRGRR
jgi:hypothetical protein